MEIKVLGPGCSKCISTYERIARVLESSQVEARLEKVDDIMEIMKYNVLSTPAVVVDGVVKVKGYVPSEDEIKKILGIG